MKKNYFGMIMAAVVMMIAGFSLTSCSEKDVAIVDGEVWVKPDYQLTDDGAIVKGNSPADISRMMNRIKTEISDAAKAGKTFKISVDAVINSTSSDNEISIPTPPDADLVLSFTNPIQTEVPLILKSKGVGDDAEAQESTNKLEIDLPSGSSGIDLELIFPTSSVTLKGNATIDELISTTGWETLNIESGVTVDWLMLKGGKVVVKDGGKVLGLLNWIEITDKGIMNWNLYKKEIPASPTADDYYYVDKAKIIKNEDGSATTVFINSYAEDPENEVEIIISDGAIAQVSSSWWYYYYPGVSIIGEGDAKIMSTGYKGEDGKVHSDGNVHLRGIKNISNVTIDGTTVLLWNKDTRVYDEVELEEDIDDIDLTLPLNAENCEFITIDSWQDPFWYRGFVLNDNIVTSTFNNCKLTLKSKETTGSIQVCWPRQTKDRTSYKLIFDNCEFNNIKFYTYFEGNAEDYKDYECSISLDNSKKDGKAITKDTDLIWYAGNFYTEDKAVTTTYYNIDGTTYIPTWDETAGKWKLVEPEAE